MRIMIKRVVTTALVIILCLGAVLPALASTNDPIPQIRIDSEFVHIPSNDQSPVIVDGRTLVPIRAVMETLGFDVEWLGHITECVAGVPLQGVASLSRNNANGWLSISVGVGHQHIVVTTTHSQRVELDVPAQIINDRTMVPVRAIAEATGYTVTWDGYNFIVDIITDGGNQVPQQSQPEATSATEFEQRLFELINIERVSYGIYPLQWNNGLASAAREHSHDLLNMPLGHTGSDGSTPTERALRHGVNTRGVAENAQSARESPEHSLYTWMRSPGHRANILDARMIYAGVGSVLVVNNENETVFINTLKLSPTA